MKGIKIQENNGKYVIIAAIPFKHLYGKVRYTNREASEWNPYSEDFNDRIDETYYQRLIENERVKNIEKFILESLVDQENDSTTITTVFPSSMIIAFDVDNELKNEDEFVNFDIPDQNNSCLIVDGQHRFAGMQRLYEHTNYNLFLNDKISNKEIRNKIENYLFNCTIILNFTIWEQSQLFINVNFYQKRVNKSLFYDIFGSTPPENRIAKNNGIYLSHMLALFLNNSEKSPLKNFVKLLGTGQGYFSQAFIVEAIMIHFSTRGVWASIEKDFQNNGNKHEMLPKVFVSYFNAVKDVFSNYWPNENDIRASHLVKTTGMGALIRLLGYMYKLLSVGAYPNLEKVDFENIETDKLTNLFKEIFRPLKSKEEDLFGKESEFAGTGGAGLQSKLYKKLCNELGLTDTK